MNIYDEIRAERARQDAKWGGPQHDDQESGTNWTDYITRYAAWAGMMWLMGGKGLPKYRRRMMQIAALAVAACESFDRSTTPKSRCTCDPARKIDGHRYGCPALLPNSETEGKS